jgi:hypothetical protein
MERNSFTRPGFIISAALIAALIAAVIALLLVPRGDDNSNAAPVPSDGTNSSAPATPADVEESVCGLPGSAETALGTAPDTNWELSGPMAVPSEPASAGPGEVTGSGVPFCFAQSPTGALYAASNILASVLYVNQTDVFKHQVAEGILRDEAMEELSSSSASGIGDAGFQIKGFRLDNYGPSEATVTLGLETENGSVGEITLPLIWQTGDWKMVLEQSGLPEPRQLNDLSGFIAWSGV